MWETEMRYFLFVLSVLLIACAPIFETSMCRHRAVECALVWGEKVGNNDVQIAIGPTSLKLWHGQVFIPSRQAWIVNTGNACEIGDKEKFTPQIHMSIAQFMQFQFAWVK